MFSCYFTSRLHRITLNVLGYSITIWVIIVGHVLLKPINTIFFFFSQKSKAKMIINISLLLFKFYMKDVPFQRIKDRVNKNLTPAIFWPFFDYIILLINLVYFELLRRTEGRFYQINIWWISLLKEFDALDSINHFLSNFLCLFTWEAVFNLKLDQ